MAAGRGFLPFYAVQSTEAISNDGLQAYPRWCWVITLATFTQYFLVLGLQFNFSILFLSLQGEFGTSAAITGWLGSLSASLSRLSSPATVLLEQRLRKRTVTLIGLGLHCAGLLMTSFVSALGFAYLTYGVLSGVGANLVLHSSMELLITWFAKGNFARASALVLLGSTTGLLATSPLLTLLITRYGWRNALRILSGGIFVLGIAVGLLMTDPPSANENSSEGATQTQHQTDNPMEMTHRVNKGCETEDYVREENKKDYVFVSNQESQDIKHGCDSRSGLKGMSSFELWLWYVANLLTFLGWDFFNINFASYMEDIGLHSDQISYAIIALAGGELGGKILIALIGNRLPFKYVYVVVSSCLLAAVPLGCMTVVQTFAAMMPIAIASGFLRSGAYGVLYTAGAELFLVKYGISVVMLLTVVPPGFGILVSAPLSGSLFDATGNYFVSLVVIAAFFVCAAAAFLFIPVLRKIRSRALCRQSRDE